MCILEDKLAQFQITQNDARFVAVSHNCCNLLEEMRRIRIFKPTSSSHVGVQIAIVPCKECIHTRRPNDDLLQLDDTIMGTQPEVRC